MIIETSIKAYKRDTNILIDEYAYTRPLDSVGRDTLAFWMGATEWLNPFCTFVVSNKKDGVGEEIVLGNPPEGDLF